MLKLFSNRSIAAKLAAMTIVGAICMALVATTVLLIARSQLLIERTEKAHAVVDVVWSLADAYQRMAAVRHDHGGGREEEVLRGRQQYLVRGPHQLSVHLRL